MQVMRTPVIGYVLSVIGLAVGVAAGGYAGEAIADANRSGDLGDLGLGLVAVGAGGLLGGAAGVFVFLAVARQPASLSTALLTLPLALAGLFSIFSLSDRIPRSSAGDAVVWIVTLSVALAVPLGARLLATRISRQGPRPDDPTP